MFKKIALSAAVAACAITAIPAAADAQNRHRPVPTVQAPQRDQAADRRQRQEVRRQQSEANQRRCRNGGDTGSILGAIAGGLLGRGTVTRACR